ncbi:MAG: T9SS type A sorting domain-containing protein [Bacteroidetes bacterium]|nr:T9SS type A sorting domain-containing protein [Bacteroidota bacterium]
MHKLLLLLFLFISMNAPAQFTGESGVYYLGTANIPISITNYSNPTISGAVVRFTWDELEHTPNNFNWAFIDAEIAKAVTYNKKISLQPLGVPHWLDSIGAQKYYYIDKNTAHTTYGQVVSNVLPWDTTYVIRYKNLLQQLAVKYSSNATVSYINAVGVAFSRGLPDTVITDTTFLIKHAFWTAFNYNADTLGQLMMHITDYYMALFPATPLWCSVDYVIFQPDATGQARNYLASVYCNYGITKYPDRFGLFREDISACNPPPSISSGSQWYIMQQNHCRTGAQMLWSLQDGPTRMNPCGILPNTKSIVLDSAVNKGLSFGMRYLEIYGSDIADASLTTSIQQANTRLIAKGSACNTATDIMQQPGLAGFSIFPNPAAATLNISFLQQQRDKQLIEMYNAMGVLIKEIAVTDAIQLNIADLPCGLYFIRCKNYPLLTQKFIKQ